MYSKKNKKWGRYLILIAFLVIIVLYLRSFLYGLITINQSFTIDKWDAFSKIYASLSLKERIKLRRYMYFSSPDVSHLQIGTYSFSWSYTPEKLVGVLLEGPQSTYTKVRFLEGWSMYDIDNYLVQKWYILKGEYIQYVSNKDIINTISQRYPFVLEYLQSHTSIQNLEWLLYPDTYYIDPSKPILDQIIKLQLNAFRDKVALPYSRQIQEFSSVLKSQGYSFSMWWHAIVTLASIIEKEERSKLNKPIIAWIFLNRIQQWMRIDADITLCYGLKQWYESCTPSLIVKSLWDVSNLYNTRVHKWLTPTPISNPSAETFRSLLLFQKTNNIYYLHDSNGQIWYAEDLQWHNSNKSKYL